MFCDRDVLLRLLPLLVLAQQATFVPTVATDGPYNIAAVDAETNDLLPLQKGM